jgi:hypothetical protein
MTTDRFARLRARGPGIWLSLWLVLCVLLAQHAGLTHRVQHGGLMSQPLAAVGIDTTVSPDHAGQDRVAQKSAGHSCVLFDGATVADSHCGAFDLPAFAFGKPVKPASLAWRWPDLPSAHPFRSRAPPVPAIAFA